MTSFPFAGTPDASKSDILRIADAERARQWRRLIMIPSESICHPAAAEVLNGELGSIYAEGLPQPALCHDPRGAAGDETLFQAWQNRLQDRRYYKGAVNANRVELIAHRAIAAVFAMLDGSPSAEDIHVNVQALSGAAANQAVYEALLQPGERVMGLDLSHGGHLTHGSIFNFSGKRYEVHSYGIEESTRRLDYGKIRERAREARPRIIIGGASAYPWDFDWAALRGIADEVGAFFLADIAHLAGMVAAGVLNNPLPHAHVITFTTHKTLCGPRGAVVMTTLPEIAKRLDMAVFPGLQGGPHMNSIAAIARLFELILEDREGFARFQRSVVENTSFFARCLTEEGFALEYAGTNTHMALVDLKKFPVFSGEPFLDGEIASRLLEIAGIVCNKNVIPGDGDAAHASGLRFGLPWLTQRGVTSEQLREIARLVKFTLERVRTCTIWSPAGEKKCRGRVPPDVLRAAAEQSLAIADALPYPPRPPSCAEKAPVRSTIGNRTALLLRGDKVRLALGQMLTARLPLDGTPVRAEMLDSDGREIADVIAQELDLACPEPKSKGGPERWLLLPTKDRAGAVRRWIEDLSDGYLMFDERDLQQKIDGPIAVEEYDVSQLPHESLLRLETYSAGSAADATKPWFIGQRKLYTALKPPPKENYQYVPAELPTRRTVLNAIHHQLSAKMAPFAGWEMPIQYPTGILAEHRAVRTAAGLFDVSHMSVFEVAGPHAVGFLELLLANRASWLAPGEAQYSSALYPDGTHIDDLYVYRLDRERFMLVLNASNAERVVDWAAAVNSRRFAIDQEMPAKEIDAPVRLRDLRHAGDESLIGLAFQGPASPAVLQKLADKASDRGVLERLVPNAIATVRLAGLKALVARTGYTGEKKGFEIYVHPINAEQFWNAVLTAGKPLGVLPAGLGARDSTRVEAGFPLFGHELEGELGLSMTEAGYGFVVRLHQPFFIGRERYMDRARHSRRHILRLRGQGRKTLRSGHVILDGAGRAVGRVTSFAYVHEDMTFIVLACVEESFQPAPGSIVRGARAPEGESSSKPDERSLVELTALARFPDDEERAAWPSRYAKPAL